MLVIAGKNNIAVNALNYVIEQLDIKIAVVCNETDDGVHSWQQSLRKTAKDKEVRILTLAEAYDVADVFLSLEFDKIIRPANFRTDRLYNIHFSLLPKYKGMYTSIWPILNDEGVSGVTLHEIDAGIDTGAIVDQRAFSISENDRASDLYDNYLRHSYELFINNIKNLISGKTISKKQSPQRSTYYAKSSIDFKNLSIDLNQTAYVIKKQILAYSFRVYQLPVVNGRRITGAKILNNKSIFKPGVIFSKDDHSIDCATIDYDIRLYFDRMSELHYFGNCTVDEAGYLLSGLAGIHDKNENGWSPIIVAAFAGNKTVVQYLLNMGANANDTNFKGTSVLMYAKDFALRSKNKDIFDLLIENGADIEHRDFSGKNLRQYITLDEANYLGISK